MDGPLSQAIQAYQQVLENVILQCLILSLDYSFGQQDDSFLNELFDFGISSDGNFSKTNCTDGECLEVKIGEPLSFGVAGTTYYYDFFSTTFSQ